VEGHRTERPSRGRSQRVTRSDIAAGRIRVPVTTATKSLLPPKRMQIEVVLKGVALGACAYHPRIGGEHERSGVITIGKVLRKHVVENEVLPIAANKGGVVYVGDRGSKLRIAQWVETKAVELDDQLKRSAPTLRDFAQRKTLDWRSPRLASDFRELSADLWRELELPAPDPHSDGFWPLRQPHWDAVARVEGPHGTQGVILLEAKSHLAELSNHCTASAQSRRTILRSLNAAKSYLGVPKRADWLTGYYQAANRLAFLYYLRARRSIPTWLFFVYFLGDKFEVEGVARSCLKSKEEWKPVLQEMHAALMLPQCHPFTHFARDVFLPT
jgi:hypothetical protein